jgi:MazG family protein
MSSAPKPAPHTGQPSIDRLLEVMARLRDPENGCPWDVQQSFATIAPYTIEEAYEVAAAIEDGDLGELKDELGDLLLQVVFHARMAEEAGAFAFEDVAAAISDKMIRRHPHVFGGESAETAEDVKLSWEEIKAAERAEKAENTESSALDGVSKGLPALLRAAKLQKRAARVGFDWPESSQVFLKIDEELAELKEEIENGAEHDRIEDELGDLFFVLVNLARHLKVDPETALRRCNGKFERRFRALERDLTETGRSLQEASLDEMEAGWQAAKQEEKA